MVRTFLFLFLIIIFFGFAPVKIFAQQNNYPMSTDSNVPQNFHNYTQSAFIEIFSALSCQLSGIDPTNPNGQCLGVDQKTGKIGFVNNGGVLGFVNSSITAMYDIPIHSGDYFKTLASNFGIAKKAVAASNSTVGPGEGAGFQSLIPFQGLWRTMRNIVYVLFVLLFLFVGLGIMFRVKIDPRTVMTIQNQLPKIVIALILVTFSYAIAGFMIDTMNVTMYLSYGIISQATDAKQIKNLTPADIQNKNPFYAAGAIYDNNPIVGLPLLTFDVSKTAVKMLKNAAGIGEGSTDPRLDASGETGKPPTITGFFGGVATAIPEAFQHAVENLPGILGTILGHILSPITYVLKLPGEAVKALSPREEKATGVQGGNTILNYIIHTVSIAAGIYGGIQIAQWQPGIDFAAKISNQACLVACVGETTDNGIHANPGPAFSIPVGVIGGIAITVLTEQILRNVLPNLLGFFLVLSILITAMLRLWYQLIKAYILALLGVIFAPFWIALGVIPGSQNVGFTPWLRNLAANLAVFPVTYTMFLIAKLVIDGVKPGKNPFVPPFIGDQNSSSFGAVLAIGILLLTPQVLEIVRDFFKVQRFKYGAAVTSSIAVGQQMVAAPIKGTLSKAWGVDPYTKEPKFLTRRFLERQAVAQSGIGRGLGKLMSFGMGETEKARKFRMQQQEAGLIANLAKEQRGGRNEKKMATIKKQLGSLGVKNIDEEVARHQETEDIAKARAAAERATYHIGGASTTPPPTMNADTILAKPKADWTTEEKEFLDKADLTDEQKTKRDETEGTA